MPPVRSILETCLSVDHLERSKEFYTRVFGFRVVTGDARLCALEVSPANLLLLFQRGAPQPPGAIPDHGTTGPAHFAFGIDAGSEREWRAHLEAHGVAIESQVRWPRGGVSLYFRDPDGHLGELAPPSIWGLA